MRISLVLLAGAIATGAHSETPPNLAELIAAHPRIPELASGQKVGEEVAFPSGGMTLKGYLNVPDGAGPFPALLWNHGSEPFPRRQHELAHYYNSRGYVFFIPIRRGHR